MVILVASCNNGNSVKKATEITVKKTAQKKIREIAISNTFDVLPRGKKSEDEDHTIKADVLKIRKERNKNGQKFSIYHREFSFDTILNTQHFWFRFSKEFLISDKQQINNHVLELLNDAFNEFKDNVQEPNSDLRDSCHFSFYYQTKIDMTSSFNDSIYYEFSSAVNLCSGSSMINRYKWVVPFKMMNEMSFEKYFYNDNKYRNCLKFVEMH